MPKMEIFVVAKKCRALACTLYRLGDFETARQYAVRGCQVWRSGAVQAQIEEVSAPAVSCLYFEALCEWHLGEIPSCHVTMAQAISLAKELNVTHATAESLFFAAVLGCCARSCAEVERLASNLIELSTLQNFAFWLAGAEIFRGWAPFPSPPQFGRNAKTRPLSAASYKLQRLEEMHGN
jgi:hypothetical protein